VNHQYNLWDLIAVHEQSLLFGHTHFSGGI